MWHLSRMPRCSLMAYVGKATGGRYEPFIYKRSLPAADVEISDEVFVITAERAEAYLAEQAAGQAGAGASDGTAPTGPSNAVSSTQATGPNAEDTPATSGVKAVPGFTWSGEIPHQKWMNFYTKVLSRFSNSGGLKIRVTVDVTPPGGVSSGSLDETRTALRELGAVENLEVK
jgi:hypothetical protein